MPKKFDGENSKAAVAKARKTAAKEAEQAKKQQQAEDEYWKDDDKKVAKKQQRKEDQEKKKTEQLVRNLFILLNRQSINKIYLKGQEGSFENIG